MLAGLGVVVAVATVGLLSVAIGAVGLVLFVLGLLGLSRIWLSAGALVLFAAVAVAALVTSDALTVLLAGAMALLAWDFAERAVTLRDQLGRRGVTRRLRVVHAGSTSLVATAGVGTGYVMLSVAPGSVPLVALVALLIGVVLLVGLLGD